MLIRPDRSAARLDRHLVGRVAGVASHVVLVADLGLAGAQDQAVAVLVRDLQGAGVRQRRAADRLRDTGRVRIDYSVYEDDDGWKAQEQTYGSRHGAVHGPFASEEEAEAHREAHPNREPIEFEIDVYRPLEMPDEGTWTFEGVFAWLSRNQEEFAVCHKEHVWSAWNRSTEGGWTRLKQALKDMGYNSVTYVNETEDAGSRSWIVFDPERSTASTAGESRRSVSAAGLERQHHERCTVA